MYMLLLLLLFTFARAEWPPTKCQPNVRQANNNVYLTSRRGGLQETSCNFREPYRSIFYLHATRRYGKQGSGDSTLEIKVMDKGTDIPIVIHNDRITLQTDTNVCYFPTVTEYESSFWIRFRLHAMLDLRKTFVTLSVMPMDSEEFVDCAKFETNAIIHDFLLSLTAKTQTGMEQIVHTIVQHRPDIKKDTSVFETRLNRLEERLRRLQNTVTEYVESHDKHVDHVDAIKTSLKASISETHNRIVTRSNSHAMVYSFFFVVLFICGFAYIRWKRTEERRFHLS
jgi:hypothetical protein